MLKRLTGRGAFDTIRSFIIALHISRSDLSPAGLECVTVEDIATMMQVPVTEDVLHEKVQGVMVEKRNELWKMVQMIKGVMNETGAVLRRGGYKSLGGLVVECATRSKVQGKEGVSGSYFVHHVPSSSARPLTAICCLLSKFAFSAFHLVLKREVYSL